ncbi:hypothetical protein SAMN05216241_11547 [Limimonas halophila]|uniref:Uncharacterized protein n=1 Tax=Limimonas halophila TaxID=1082479 RepID=A0A1G7PYU5_9PROT|nr:hypothetical protein SAMN05216241_103140 [Limimonas halophila]SDG42314.1 hypothetical protein SAMN05216241_1123 [Limimonas halophila]SDG48993.1 hypothetical protein SAMN05216241_11547 [Limimonas halophila]
MIASVRTSERPTEPGPDGHRGDGTKFSRPMRAWPAAMFAA